MMKKLPDLERKITRIHACASVSANSQGVAEALASQKRAVRELVAVLQVPLPYSPIFFSLSIYL